MLQEGVTDQEQVLVLSWETALVDDEVTFVVAGLVKVLLWINFKDVVTHLETDWLQFWSNAIAGVSNMAEGLVGGAIKVWDCSSPLIFDFVEHIRWD